MVCIQSGKGLLALFFDLTSLVGQFRIYLSDLEADRHDKYECKDSDVAARVRIKG